MKTSKRRKKPESGVQKAVIDYLKLAVGCPVVIRVNSGTVLIPKPGGGRYAFRGADKGTSDIVGMLPDARFFAFETKRVKGGRTTDEQQEFIDRVIAGGGVGGVVKGIEDVERILKEDPEA